MKPSTKRKLHKIGIIVGSIISIIFCVFLFLFSYYELYMPYKGRRLYKEGIQNPNKAVDIAQELHNTWEYKVNSKSIENILYNAAMRGNIQAMLLLGQYHSNGFHSYFEPNEHDWDKAAYWYLQAAQKGNAEAQAEIGLCYKYGKGVRQDFSKALFWLNKGSTNHNAKALYELGHIYQYGLALYDGYYYYFKGPYHRDYNYTNLIYEGDLTFIAKGGRKYTAKEKFLDDILENPHIIFMNPNKSKAEFYLNQAARQGLQEAKEALQKIY